MPRFTGTAFATFFSITNTTSLESALLTAARISLPSLFVQVEFSTSGPAGLYLPAGLTIDYENVGLFQKYVAPGQQLEYLILLTNQVGPKKVSVYGFLKKKS